MNSSMLLDEMFRCVDSIGYDATLKLLQDGQIRENPVDDDRAKFVVDLVADKFEIPAYEIFYGRARKNDRPMALGFCIYYLFTEDFFDIKMDEVARLLKQRNTMVCYSHIRRIKGINEKHMSDKKYAAIKKEMDIKVMQHINQTRNLNKKNN